MPSLLDLGSEVSLIHHTYFKKHFLARIEIPTGEKENAYTLFNLTAVNDRQLPVYQIRHKCLGAEGAEC